MAATPARAGGGRLVGSGEGEGSERGCERMCERARVCARGRGPSTQRHHHRCYLNVFVGREGDGRVINVQVERRAAPRER